MCVRALSEIKRKQEIFVIVSDFCKTRIEHTSKYGLQFTQTMPISCSDLNNRSK